MTVVYFYEAFAEEATVIRHFLPKDLACEFTDRTVQECGHVAPPAKIISTRTQSRIPTAWSHSLEAILTRSTGYDHITAFASGAPRVPAMGYLPLYCNLAVAEQALTMWMSLLRKLPRQMRQFQTFHRDLLTGRECRGRTLVVVGVGHIGSEVCRIGDALGMRVLGVDVQQRYPGVSYVSPVEALPQADVIVCAMDLNPSSVGYFDSARLQTLKRGVAFVNISRGELSPSSVLLEGVRSGILGGVGLDVYDHEAELAVSLRSGKHSDDAEVQAVLELAKLENVLLMPHNAFNTEEAVERKSEHSVQQIEAFLKTGQFKWPVPRG